VFSQHPIFYVSDRSGHTAETLARSLLAQFPDLEAADPIICPFVDNKVQALQVVERIQEISLRRGCHPVVFSTLIDSELQTILHDTDACVIDLFGAFIGPIEGALGVVSAHTAGLSRREVDAQDYQNRIDAIEFAMNNDDGVMTRNFDLAEVIITGVSRTGKTPTCIYLAMNFGIKACNYPLVHEDFDQPGLPETLLEYRDRLVGFTISPKRLRNIRQHRRPDSDYADHQQIEREIRIAEQMFSEAGIRSYDTSDISIEELSARIIKDKQLLQRIT